MYLSFSAARFAREPQEGGGAALTHPGTQPNTWHLFNTRRRKSAASLDIRD